MLRGVRNWDSVFVPGLKQVLRVVIQEFMTRHKNHYKKNSFIASAPVK